MPVQKVLPMTAVYPSAWLSALLKNGRRKYIFEQRYNAPEWAREAYREHTFAPRLCRRFIRPGSRRVRVQMSARQRDLLPSDSPGLTPWQK